MGFTARGLDPCGHQVGLFSNTLFRDNEKVERGTEEGDRAKGHMRHESRMETRGSYREK